MATFTTFTKTDTHVTNATKTHSVPETAAVAENSAKRNILRKGKTGGPKGKFKSKITEDGSSVLIEPRPALDPGDPLYDVEDDEDYILSGGGGVLSGSPSRRNYDPDFMRMVVGSSLTLAEFKRRLTVALEEYFESEDHLELTRTVSELECPDYLYEVVKKSISMSLDRAERERELVSKFLSEAYGCELLSTDVLGKGFERLFEMIDDLEIDCPGAGQSVAVFLARALIDEILPPSFLIDPVVSSLGGEVVSSTKRMLSRDHQYSRLERSWGPGDGRPVPELKQAIDALLNEYLISFDMLEAERCVRELRVPHFHHELMKRAIVLVMDKDSSIQEVMGKLIQHLHSTEAISTMQVQQGLLKVHCNMGDLMLDAPRAPEVFDYFCKLFAATGITSPDFVIQ